MAMADGSSSEELNLKAHALKPLEELTDADIRQLTREDCRRYLKERGMRRPSWNKAQAIQQVLSLRSLMCSSSTSGKTCSKADASAAAITNAEPATVPQTKQLLDKVSSNAASDPIQQHSFLHDAASIFPLRPVQAPPHRAQLTIFYSGVVNVYEDVPVEKAQAIMLLAASKTFQVPATNPCTTTPLLHTPGTQAPAPPNHHVYVPSPFLTPPEPIAAAAGGGGISASLNNTQHEESTDSGLPQARTISLQKFLAKRRERISANPSFYRRCDKQQQQSNKRGKTSSSPPPALPPVPPARTASPLRTTTTSNHHNHHINNPHTNMINITSDPSTATTSSDTSTTAATSLRSVLDKIDKSSFLHSKRNLLGVCKDRFVVDQVDHEARSFQMK